MSNVNVVDILRLGAIGLGFLLALMAYRLLAKEQAKEVPREAILLATRSYMLFAIVLVVVAAIAELIKPMTTTTAISDNKPAFNFDDYLAKMRIQYAHAATPEQFRRGELAELKEETLVLELPAGTCKTYLAVVPPSNECEMNWWMNGAGARDVKITRSGTPNVRTGEVCTSEDPSKAAEVGMKLKMTRGSGPYALETYFSSQRVYGTNKTSQLGKAVDAIVP
jgi:hypothetical protein